MYAMPGAFPRYYLVIELLCHVEGEPYPAAPGARRCIYWKIESETPPVVRQARAGQPIDWGGQLVPADRYRVIRDTEREVEPQDNY